MSWLPPINPLTGMPPCPTGPTAPTGPQPAQNVQPQSASTPTQSASSAGAAGSLSAAPVTGPVAGSTTPGSGAPVASALATGAPAAASGPVAAPAVSGQLVGPSLPSLPTAAAIPAAWTGWYASVQGTPYAALGGAILATANVVANLTAALQAPLTQANQCNCNCGGVAAGQMQLAIQQSQQIIDNKINKIAQQLFAMVGQAMGRLQTVTPPTPQLPQLQAFLPTGPTGPLQVPLPQTGPTGYTGYTPPPSPLTLPSGVTPPPLGGPIYQPGYLPTGPTGITGPTGSNILQQTIPSGGGTIQVPGPGPCTIHITCFDIAMANAIAAAVSNAIVNAVTVLFTGAGPPGFVMPGTQLPSPTGPAPTGPQFEKFKAAYQWESGPTIYTRPPDEFMFPTKKDKSDRVTDDQGNEVL